MEQAHSKFESKVIKVTLGVLVGFVLFIVACWGGCRAYTNFEQRHLTRRAVGFLGGNNLKEAALCARRAWQMGPNADAARIMAQIGERSGDRNAIEWRQKVLEFAPNSPDDNVALATSALQFGEAATAERALHGVPPGARDTAAFHAAAARLADSRKSQRQAQEEWRRAVELAPDNVDFRMQYALCGLRSEDGAASDAARGELERLRLNEKQRVPATRALIAYAVGHRERTEKIYQLAQELQAYPEHDFPDRLLFLDVLRQLQHADYTKTLTQIENDAAGKPGELAALITWMNGSGLAALAVDFARTLPNEQRVKWPVPQALVEANARLEHWDAVVQLVKNADWGRNDFLRHAQLARAYRALGNGVASEHEWAAATKDASAQAESLSTLVRTVIDWGWKKEAVELLWALTKFPEKQRDALQSLYLHFNKELDSQGLYKVTLRMAELDPEDVTLQNNLAQISLLLGVDRERARKTAAEVYAKDPDNPAFASTHAFALFTRGDAAQAAQIMQRIPHEDLAKPELAAYLGLFLANAGDTAGAREWLAKGANAKLLPEERGLIDDAKKRAGM